MPRCCCSCFPACLNGTELRLDIADAEGPWTIEWPCEECSDGGFIDDLTRIYYLQALNGTYTLDYAGSGIYSLVFGTCSDIAALRANSILLHHHTDIACCPASNILDSDREEYLTKIEATLSCNSATRKMTMAIAFTITQVARFRSACPTGTWGSWSCPGFNFLSGLPECSPQPDVVGVQPCALNTEMAYDRRLGTISKTATCDVVSIDCGSDFVMQVRGKVQLPV